MLQTPTRRFVVCIADHFRADLIGKSLTMDLRQRLVLGRGGNTLGSDALLDPRMSRRHAALVHTEQGLSVEDLGSRNGTLVDGHLVQRCLVRENAVIGLGRVLLQVWPEPGTDAPVVPPPLLSCSPALWPLLRALPDVAQSHHPLLITGEDGAGKRTVAEAIHRLSGRRGPIHTLLPATIAPEQVRVCLHGNAATPQFEGALHRAEGGTLVVHRIEKTPIPVQQLLREFLEDGLLRPVGGEPRPANVRLVFTTCGVPARATAPGTVFDALGERLRAGMLHLPSLRERPQDILPLARHLACRHAGRPVALGRLLALLIVLNDWPGNGRELSDLLARLVAEHPGSSALSTPAWGPASFGPRARELVNTFDSGRSDLNRRRP